MFYQSNRNQTRTEAQRHTFLPCKLELNTTKHIRSIIADNYHIRAVGQENGLKLLSKLVWDIGITKMDNDNEWQDLIEYGPHRFIDLCTCSSVGRTFWERSGDVIVLEEVYFWDGL